ncbi:MAG: polyprenyl synthetase, partial [Methanosarcinales archaeon]|nr:polyprenyl synthetase [Methanosarcinales archaeon]
MYRLIGIALLVIVIVSIFLVIFALWMSRASLSRNILLAGFFANILDFFYLPIKAIFFRYSDTEKLEKWMVSLKNMAHKSGFKKTK